MTKKLSFIIPSKIANSKYLEINLTRYARVQHGTLENIFEKNQKIYLKFRDVVTGL